MRELDTDEPRCAPNAVAQPGTAGADAGDCASGALLAGIL